MKNLLLALLVTLAGCGVTVSEADPGSELAPSDVADGDASLDASDPSCPEGTTGTPGACIDINECAVDASAMNDCGDADYVSCTNQEAAPPICTDINECAVDSQGDNGCGAASLFDCTNRDAAAPLCADRDECLTDNGGCGEPSLSSCSNQDGAPPLCVDVDECLTDNGGCGEPALVTCVNQQAAVPLCEDVNECLTDNGGCGDPELMDCVNQEAAPPVCQPASQEPDLCDTEDDEACGVNGSCTDPGVGPADCACDAGFAGDGWICAPSDTLGCTNPKASNYAPWATKSSEDCIFPVTFTVDLNGSGSSPSTPVYIQGGFNDWCGYCMPLSDPDGDGIWTQTYYLGPGSHEYLFSQNGWDNPESLSVGSSCDATPTDQYANRGFTVTDSGLTLDLACFGSCACAEDKGTPVTFMVDLGCDETPSNASKSVRVSGSFCDWCEDGYELADPDGDGRWMNTFLLHGSSIDYLYQLGPGGPQETLLDDLAEGAPATCAPSTDQSTYAYRQLGLGDELLAMDTFGQCAPCGSDAEAPTWVLQWSDEFDGEALDLDAWTPQLGDGSQYGIPGWGNGELQSYKAENAIVADGHLTLRAKQESSGGKAYTSARIRTTATFSSGRIEARVKQPAGKGLWPAFWMLPEGGDWPMDGEIDIMEFRGEHTHETLGTIHYGDAWDNKGSSGKTLATEDDLSEDFHIYAIEWRPGSIQWFFDDQLFHSVTPMQVAPYTWPFDSGEFYILLNLAIGGGFVEAPDASTPFPSDLVIDYVRVFSEETPNP
jgi:beta-glucanase (GH16 family)